MDISDRIAPRNRTLTRNTMKGAAPEAATDAKSPLLLSKELRRIAAQMRLNGISIIFERTRDRRFITITKSNRPETAASTHVSASNIERSIDHLIDGQNLASHVTPLPVRP
jgi:hypothetical protein